MDYSDFGKHLRKVVSDFYADGVVLEKSNGKYISNSLPYERVKVLRKLITLIMKTSFTDEYTKIYLSNEDYTYQKVTDILNEKYGKGLKVTQVKGKIWHNIRKVSNLLGAEALKLIINYRDNKVNIYEEIIDRELLKYRKVLQSGVLIDIQTENFRTSLDEEEFKRFLEIIKPYTLRGVEQARKQLTNEMLEYVNYLNVNLESLGQEDLKRYQAIMYLIKE